MATRISHPTITILGATGFLGLHLSQVLVEKGFSNIRALSRNHPDIQLYPHLEKLEWFKGDFSDKAIVEEIVDGSDCIFHFASDSNPLTPSGLAISGIKSNLIPTLQLLELLKNKPIKLIYASSGGTIYGKPKTLPIDERHPLEPINAYGMQKLVTEEYLRLYKTQFNLQYLSLRIGNPYGQYQSPKKNQGIIRKYIDNIINDQPVEVWGDGSSSRDYLYVDDLTDSLLKSINYEGAKNILNVGSGLSHSILDILNILRSITNKDFTVLHKEVKQVHAQIPEIQLDINAIRKELLWAPKTSLEEGIEILYNKLVGEDS